MHHVVEIRIARVVVVDRVAGEPFVYEEKLRERLTRLLQSELKNGDKTNMFRLPKRDKVA